MDFTDIFNLLIVGGVVLGPMIAKMKINKSKASGLGSADAGTGLRKPVPSQPGVSTRSTTANPIAKTTANPTAPGQRTVRSRRIKPAKSKARPAKAALPVHSAVVGSPQVASQVAPALRMSGQPRRRHWTTLQQAVILREMLDRPLALREGDRL